MTEHRIAKLTAVATFLLLVIGGTVNPTGSSLACPEPTILCNQQLFPPMVGGVLYEHGHRLAAMTVGLLQILLTVVLWRRRRDLRALGVALLLMVISQGALGAITVAYKLPWFVSTAHLMLAMLYFATLIYTSFRTAPSPHSGAAAAPVRARAELAMVRGWVGLAAGAVMLQLVLGALVRHLGAAMVCLGMPSCLRDGTWWPDAGVQRLHMLHRGVGILVAVITIAAAVAILRKVRLVRSVRVLAVLSVFLVLGQVALGVYSVLTLRSVPVVVAHFAGAAALWALWSSAWFLVNRDRDRYLLVATEPGPARGAATRSAARGVV